MKRRSSTMRSSTKAGRHKRATRQGTLYVAVLGVTMIVGMITLASVAVGRLELRRTVSRGHQREAELLAQSAIEFGYSWTLNQNNWRQHVTSGVEEGPEPLGNGTFTWSATDEDGDLDNGDTDSFVLRGIGRVGDVVAVEEVTVSNNGPALTCLNSALHVQNDITLEGGSTFSWRNIYTDQEVSTNSDINAGSGVEKIDGDAWAVGSITGQIDGVSSANQSPAREMPDTDVFDYYIANGTTIDITSIPESGGVRVIERQVISTATNPYGAANPLGIYVIDCQGQNVRIRLCRILGTLVLLNNGNDSSTKDSLCWEPAVTGYPALLVENDFQMCHTGWVLHESTDGVNYNPPGTPYDGEEDSDLDDTHGGRFWGIVYVGGTLRIDSYLGFIMQGVTVCNQLEVLSISTFNYDSTYTLNPPPGFRGTGAMEIEPGSWRRVAY